MPNQVQPNGKEIMGYSLSLAAMKGFDAAAHRAGWTIARSKEEAEEKGLKICHEVFPENRGYYGWDCIALQVLYEDCHKRNDNDMKKGDVIRLGPWHGAIAEILTNEDGDNARTLLQKLMEIVSEVGEEYRQLHEKVKNMKFDNAKYTIRADIEKLN